MTTATQLRERPILFSGPMVRAILNGSKTQTRRVVKPQPTNRHVFRAVSGHEWLGHERTWLWDARWEDERGRHGTFVGDFRCPYGQPGDRMWVRESWATPTSYDSLSPSEAMATMGQRLPFGAPQVWYRASTREQNQANHRWRPSIHMPRRISRLTLEITEVRVERLQEITEADARAEGITDGGCLSCGESEPCGCANPAPDARDSFAWLWNQINEARGFGWHANPWVWVIGFRRVEP